MTASQWLNKPEDPDKKIRVWLTPLRFEEGEEGLKISLGIFQRKRKVLKEAQFPLPLLEGEQPFILS